MSTASTMMVTVAARARARVLQRVSERLLALSAITVGILVVCPLLVYGFERSAQADITNVVAAYQWLGRTLVEGFSVYKLHTGGGVAVYYVVRIAGISLVAFLTGSISSRLIATVVSRGKGMGSTKASKHIVICGWSGKGAEILRELRAKEVEDPRKVVVLAPVAQDPTRGLAEFISGDPSDVADLNRAGIQEADTAIVLADEASTPGSDADRDARTLLTCLAIESVNPSCYTCVEVVRSENRGHFSRTRADELVVSGELTGALLASSARTHGLSGVVSDLLTHPEGAELYHVPAPEELCGRDIRHALGWVKDRYDAMLLGVRAAGQPFELNPPAARTVARGEDLLVVAPRPPTT